jgi:REP element-mobilizing transposase RayT
MPNHVHAVVTPLGEHSVSKIVQSWKSYTAHAINRQLGRSGKLWQKESFDHLVRSAESYQRFVWYTEQNPVASGFVVQPEDWLFSSARHRHSL